MRDVFPQKAGDRRRLENQLLEFFEAHGYDMVSSGSFEYVDTLLRGRSIHDSEDWIQIFDTTGRAVALRPDMTPSIARMAAPLLSAGRESVLWCYAEKVYHRTTDPASLSWLSGKAAESTQVGVECIGRGGREADVDILALCRRATDSLGLTEWQMVVSHAMFAPAFLVAVGTPESAVEALLGCLTKGDYVGFRRIAAEAGVSHDVLSWLQAQNPLSSQEMQVPEKIDWTASPAGERAVAAWDDLVSLAQELEERGLADGITFDLTLHRDLTYYTGIVFEVFAPGVGAPIALGGRYDDLLSYFGVSAPAVGFTFEIERALAAKDEGVWPTKPNQQSAREVP